MPLSTLAVTLAVSPLLLPGACARAPARAEGTVEASGAIAGNLPSGADDPALIAALRDQIMVDPALVQQANADAVRPPTRPPSGAVPPDAIAAAAMPTPPAGAPLRPAPAARGDCRQCVAARRALTLGALAAAQGGRPAQCGTKIDYSAVWAERLPPGVPLYPDARVSEAAGADAAGCALRVVSFASMAPLQRLLDWYYTRTGDAGYAAEHDADGAEHVLAGTRRGAPGAFLLVLRARRDGGTDADLLADGG